jgi:hypothetical protein
MGWGLSRYAQATLQGGATALKLECPVLVWEVPKVAGEEPLLLGTNSGATTPQRPTSQEPLVFELRKQNAQSNAFTMGVTAGRTENNDVVLPDNSVSRFHAFFQQDAKSGEWRLIDAESTNGTFVNDLRIEPNVPFALVDKAKVTLGDVKLVFLKPASFLAYVQRKLRAP